MTGRSGYAIGRRIDEPFEDVLRRTREELQAEGFGVLSEIDVQAALREKLGEEIEPYLILGACNPRLAHRGLQVEPDLGVLLPCNVVVRREGDATYVSGMEPLSALQLAENPELQPIAEEANERLTRAIERL
jgi:uncharacterized protein (DUF302 family)